MVTRESFTDNPDEVNHLIKWWISRSDVRYHRVRKHGTVNDFINDVWVRLLNSFRNGKQVECALSSAVIHSCAWEIKSWQRLGAKETWEARHKMRHAEKVRSNHRIENERNEQLTEFVHSREMDNAIAYALRSLTWREAVIVRAQFGLLGDREMTLEEIGRPLKITRERVRQIGMKGIKKLQHHTRAIKLLPFAPEELEETPMSQPSPMSKEIKSLRKSEYGQLLLDDLGL